jgi:hypothetical protein
MQRNRTQRNALSRLKARLNLPQTSMRRSSLASRGELAAAASDADVLRARRKPFAYSSQKFRGVMETNPSEGVKRDVENLKARLVQDAARAGISAQPAFTVEPVKVPDAPAGIVAAVKRLFNVRFVSAEGLPGELSFDGAYIGFNTIYVDSRSTHPFSPVTATLPQPRPAEHSPIS